MACLLCATKIENKLCDLCSEIYIYDKNLQMIRKRKCFPESISSKQKNHVTELQLYNILCKLFGKKDIFRNVHPLWAISKKNVLLEYDILINSKKLLIEYDGRQHFEFPNFYHKTKKQFLAQRARDKLKNKLAKKNGWKLIRFNYKENIDNISVERKIKLC